MDRKNENNDVTFKGGKYLWLLVIGSVRLFLCSIFYVIYKSSLFETFEVIMKAYQKVEVFLLPTIIVAALPIIFAEFDTNKYDSKQYMPRAVVCTVVWIAAVTAQIKFIQLGF